ncbi:MAG: glycosyltransferase [Verrucomicrobiota bacterium]|nr:glycosyltransferase [Verrucomicrobiota bacterium]
MPAPELRLTVAICTYNRAEFLQQTLAGIARQNFPRDQFEILVIDNNSRDHTYEVVASFAHIKPAPRHVLETHQGLDHARNRAIAEARGEIILFGDDDIIVQPDWLAQMIAPFTAAAHKIGAVGGEVVPVFPDGVPPWVAEWHSPLAFRSDTGPLPPSQSPMGANFALPRRVFEHYGLFHTALDRSGKNLFGGGDTEMIRRLRAAGLEIWFAPAARVLHQMPASRTTFRYAARHAFDSARSRVVDQAGRPGAASYLLTRAIGNFLKIPGYAFLAGLCGLVLRTGDTKKYLVRAWRACGYLYQIPRSLMGKI